ncbi:MAG: arylsulfatase A-like enzyme [Planctomycetota bacterium]|jgi:arylsulfatase A-like enzyme
MARPLHKTHPNQSSGVKLACLSLSSIQWKAADLLPDRGLGQRAIARLLMAVGILTLTCLSNSCGRPDAPRVQRLAASTKVTVEAPKVDREEGELTWIDDQDGRWIRQQIAHSSWSRTQRPGRWKAKILARGIGQPPPGVGVARLRDSHLNREFPSAESASTSTPGAFAIVFDHVFIDLEEGESVPESAVLDVYSTAGRRDRNGLQLVEGIHASGEGFATLTGGLVDLVVDIPASSSLRLCLAATSCFLGDSNGDEKVLFKVELDGVILREAQLPLARTGATEWVVIELPPEGRLGAELRFSTTGPLSYTSFLSPTIGPSDAKAMRAADGRPDLVVFLMDTFRADNLATYGGDGGLTPNLDAFAKQALVFSNTRATGTHTLPSHASIFSGLYPHQVGVSEQFSSLPDSVETIAEDLARAGYRTGAVTDSVIVSQAYGMAQGFQWFVERKISLADTLERARTFLDAGDGRPTLLYVQTYAVHSPYELDASARELLGDRLGLREDDEFYSLQERLRVNLKEGGPEEARVEIVAGLRRLYLGASAVLDDRFSDFLGDLKERDILSNGVLIVTSDHGESFGEHGELWHNGATYDELLRIPLMLIGRGINRGVVDKPASLVDLPPTLAALAGIRQRPEWQGSSLFDLPEERLLFAYRCMGAISGTSSMAILDGSLKVMASESASSIAAGNVAGAFDLLKDPGEVQDQGDQSWASELLLRASREAVFTLQPLQGRSAARIDAAKRAELNDMGYGGEADH